MCCWWWVLKWNDIPGSLVDKRLATYLAARVWTLLEAKSSKRSIGFHYTQPFIIIHPWSRHNWNTDEEGVKLQVIHPSMKWNGSGKGQCIFLKPIYFQQNRNQTTDWSAFYASHIGHVNTILYAFTEPNSKETCYNQLSPLEEITEIVEIWVTKVKE